jgi:hypothetical protein
VVPAFYRTDGGRRRGTSAPSTRATPAPALRRLGRPWQQRHSGPGVVVHCGCSRSVTRVGAKAAPWRRISRAVRCRLGTDSSFSGFTTSASLRSSSGSSIHERSSASKLLQLQRGWRRRPRRARLWLHPSDRRRLPLHSLLSPPTPPSSFPPIHEQRLRDGGFRAASTSWAQHGAATGRSAGDAGSTAAPVSRAAVAPGWRLPLPSPPSLLRQQRCGVWWKSTNRRRIGRWLGIGVVYVTD